MNAPTLQPDDILVRPQETPNPMALKFIVNRPLKNQGKATLNSPAELPGSALVSDLFGILGVRQLHLFQNTVTVTHAGELLPEELAEQVIAVIKTRLPVHDPDFEFGDEGENKKKRDRSHLSPEVIAIEEILDRTIRPGLQADGGDIEVISLEDNQLKILYQGACGGCPSSMMGTLDAIQNILQQELGNEELMVIPL
jgi:Fe-S cluster biogenesis protein NfuA